MDGLDLETIEKLDQSVFDQSPPESDEDEEEVPLPDCIGIDSALQDEEQVQLARQQQNIPTIGKTRSEIDRELELTLLRPNSIRRQILEQTNKDGNNKVENSKQPHQREESNGGGSHVMNIVEKAGMQGIDKEKINEIIHEASKGSLFYKKQAQRQEEIHKSIQKMLNKVQSATPLQVSKAKVTCDKLLEELLKQRIFNRIIVHFDLDMFFAAVEIRDNPELSDKPIAVGGDSMVSTSNYVARKFGVRAAMPGFIARKLCPDLILIKPNGFKYRQASEDVFSILFNYDPEYSKMSLDEAYLDLTEYVKNTLERDGQELDEYYDGTLPKVWWTRATEVVQEIRDTIYEKTKLTCSAGIACNALLAKISTDIKKPNGQFMVEGYPDSVKDFISKTPVGKVSGIGKVSGQFLSALEIKTCGDIYEKRHFLPLVFYEINVRFYLRVALGDGSTCIKSDEQRKSKSVERTFSSIKEPLMLLEKLDSICEELCTRFLKPYRIRGRTITVKLKRNTFTTTTKSYSMLVPTNDKSVIYSAAKNLLLAEIAQEPPEISYRLLGVKLSNLADDHVNSNQLTINAMLRNQELQKVRHVPEPIHEVITSEEEAQSPMSSTPTPDDVTAEELQPVECNQSTQLEATVAEKGIKRKELTAKRIEEFFNTQDCKRLKSSDQESSGGSDEAKPQSCASADEKTKKGIAELNEASERELRQNDPNDEDFRCPYCFKPYSDFNLLEVHVDKCYLKTSIDVYKPFFSQKPKNNDEPSISISQSQRKSYARKSSSTQPTSSKKRRPLVKNSPIIELLKSNTNNNQKPDKISEPSPKVSFYEKFLQSNSQSLVRSPKAEPLQCPYCLHGYLSFELLEGHVSTCIKNTDI